MSGAWAYALRGRSMRCRPGGSDCFSLFALSSSLMTSVHNSFFVRILNSARGEWEETKEAGKGFRTRTGSRRGRDTQTAAHAKRGTAEADSARLRETLHEKCERVYRSASNAPCDSAQGVKGRGFKPPHARDSERHVPAQGAANHTPCLSPASIKSRSCAPRVRRWPSEGSRIIAGAYPARFHERKGLRRRLRAPL